MVASWGGAGWHDSGSRDVRLLARWLDERAKLVGHPTRPTWEEPAAPPEPATRRRDIYREALPGQIAPAGHRP